MLPHDDSVSLRPGLPALVLAALLPVATTILLVLAGRRGGWEQTAEDPVAPWVIAVLTSVGAAVLVWRSLTQWAELDASGLHSRNLLSTVHLEWDQVDELRCVRRPGLMVVEIVVGGVRRRLRLGAATRFAGPAASDILDLLERRPEARARLLRPEP